MPEPDQHSHDGDAAAKARRTRILVVDDEPFVCNTVRRVLAAEYEVTTTTSAIDAAARVRAGERYDLVLCDLMMPEVSGPELFSMLAEIDPRFAARVVFVTGGAFTPAAQAFLEAPGRRHIEKPFEAAGLRAAVRAILAEIRGS